MVDDGAGAVDELEVRALRRRHDRHLVAGAERLEHFEHPVDLDVLAREKLLITRVALRLPGQDRLLVDAGFARQLPGRDPLALELEMSRPVEGDPQPRRRLPRRLEEPPLGVHEDPVVIPEQVAGVEGHVAGG